MKMSDYFMSKPLIGKLLFITGKFVFSYRQSCFSHIANYKSKLCSKLSMRLLYFPSCLFLNSVGGTPYNVLKQFEK